VPRTKPLILEMSLPPRRCGGDAANGLVSALPYSHRGSRRSYTTEQKLAVLQKAAAFPNLKSASKSTHISEQCLRRWKEHEVCLRQAIRTRGLDAAKRVYPDKMPTLSRLCRQYLEEMGQMDHFDDVTTTVLSLKATEIRDDLLHLAARGQVRPLPSHEIKCYQNFKASKGWATKFLLRFRRHREAVTDTQQQGVALPYRYGDSTATVRAHQEPDRENDQDDVVPARGEDEEEEDMSSADFVDAILKPLIEVEQKLANVDATAALKHLQCARKEILLAFAKAQTIQRNGKR
jgi:hypothetical protein